MILCKRMGKDTLIIVALFEAIVIPEWA